MDLDELVFHSGAERLWAGSALVAPVKRAKLRRFASTTYATRSGRSRQAPS
jgi:hypothetical protein